MFYTTTKTNIRMVINNKIKNERIWKE